MIRTRHETLQEKLQAYSTCHKQNAGNEDKFVILELQEAGDSSSKIIANEQHKTYPSRNAQMLNLNLKAALHTQS